MHGRCSCSTQTSISASSPSQPTHSRTTMSAGWNFSKNDECSRGRNQCLRSALALSMLNISRLSLKFYVYGFGRVGAYRPKGLAAEPAAGSPSRTSPGRSKILQNTGLSSPLSHKADKQEGRMPTYALGLSARQNVGVFSENAEHLGYLIVASPRRKISIVSWATKTAGPVRVEAERHARMRLHKPTSPPPPAMPCSSTP